MTRAEQGVEAVVPYVALPPEKRSVGGIEVQMRPMTVDDVDPMLAFGRSLSDREILVLRLNLRRRKSIEEWVAAIERGHRLTILAEGDDGRILGYASLSLREFRWYRHLGDVRVAVRPDVRSRGLGGELTATLIAIARRLGLQRLIAQVPRSQTVAAKFFRHYGFHQQVLLPDWVIDGEGHTHDLLLLTQDLRPPLANGQR